jgi:hypothetical protein
VGLALVVASCSSDKGTNGDDAPSPAPSAVTDLRVTAFAPTSVTLAWTAPVNDDEHGMVSYYDIRYTTTDPEPDDWATATQVQGEPGPLPAGMTQTMDIDSLAYGLTYYFGMKCIGAEGAESGLSNLAEIELPIDFAVAVPDSALEAVLRETLNKPTGDIRYADLVPLIEIIGNERGIVDLTGVEYCENLVFLHVNDNLISDLTPLSGLDSLWALSLFNNNISDVSPLSTVVSLEHLIIGENELTDISPLAALTGLAVFRAHYNDIVDISAVQYMTRLEWLDLTGNQVVDISPLVANTGLGTGDEVNLRLNPLSAESINTHIPALQARGVVVYY